MNVKGILSYTTTYFLIVSEKGMIQSAQLKSVQDRYYIKAKDHRYRKTSTKSVTTSVEEDPGKSSQEGYLSCAF